MEFTTTTTAVAFLLVIGAGAGALLAAPVMTVQTVLTMVLPSMIVFGLLMLALGVKHGEFRATR